MVPPSARGSRSRWLAATGSLSKAPVSAFPSAAGLHPGLGGTFRLTSLIDPLEAMTLMLTGKTAHTRKAKSLGIADEVVRERHVGTAVAASAGHKGRP